MSIKSVEEAQAWIDGVNNQDLPEFGMCLWVEFLGCDGKIYLARADSSTTIVTCMANKISSGGLGPCVDPDHHWWIEALRPIPCASQMVRPVIPAVIHEGDCETGPKGTGFCGIIQPVAACKAARFECAVLGSVPGCIGTGT